MKKSRFIEEQIVKALHDTPTSFHFGQRASVTRRTG
jgi:hypothetical protein